MSMVAHVAAIDLPFIQPQLIKIDGLEILDIVDEETKILLLLDIKDEEAFHHALKKIQNIKAIQSLSYAAHYSEEAISDKTEKDE